MAIVVWKLNLDDADVLGATLEARLVGGGSICGIDDGYTVEVTVDLRTGICANAEFTSSVSARS